MRTWLAASKYRSLSFTAASRISEIRHSSWPANASARMRFCADALFVPSELDLDSDEIHDASTAP
jgi:hypothetical protein